MPAGTYYSADGSRYEGEFQAGLKDGTGVMHYQDGERREGTWDRDHLTGS